MSACTRIGCGGDILADGYCDTCGYAGQSGAATASVPSAPPVKPPPPRSFGQPDVFAAVPPPPTAPPPPKAPVRVGASVHHQVEHGPSCSDATCSGSIAADGYCDTCGLQPSSKSATPGGSQGGASPDAPDFTSTIAVPTAPRVSAVVASTAAGGTRRSRSTSSARTELGAGLVQIAPTTVGDPAQAVLDEDGIRAVLGEKPEDERFCSACGQPVGRGSGDQPGRVKGFCGNCRTPFDFHTNMPKLTAGEIVGGQYRILGPLAHGGMGWIYLGQDTAVSNRWVVLKGLLNEDDPDAVASAVAERQFLARIEHGSIVNIYNFVTWE